MDYKGGKINVVIEINKDIDRYQESVAMGLSAKQLIFSVASVVCGGGLVFLLYPYIGLTGAAYVAIPVVTPIALGGFYSYNGMSFYEVMGKKIHFMFDNRTLTYVSTEGEQAIRSYEFEKNISDKKGTGLFGFCKKQSATSDDVDNAADNSSADNQKTFEDTKKKMKKLLMVSVLSVVTLMGIAFAYKYGYIDKFMQMLGNMK